MVGSVEEGDYFDGRVLTVGDAGSELVVDVPARGLIELVCAC